MILLQQKLKSSKSRMVFAGLLVFTVAFVHLVFKPFQLAHYNHYDYWLVNTSYFLISCLTVALHLVVLPKYKPLLFHNLLQSYKGTFLLGVSLLVSTGVSFFIFKVAFGYYPFSLARIATGILALTAISAFLAIVLFVVKKQFQATKPTSHFVAEAITIAPNIPPVALHEILYIYSDKNYVVWICLVEGIIVKHRLRGTLKAVEQQFAKDNSIVRSHRAYLVNKTHIIAVRKSHSAHTLQLRGCNEKVPMSRSYRFNIDA